MEVWFWRESREGNWKTHEKFSHCLEFLIREQRYGEFKKKKLLREPPQPIMRSSWWFWWNFERPTLSSLPLKTFSFPPSKTHKRGNKIYNWKKILEGSWRVIRNTSNSFLLFKSFKLGKDFSYASHYPSPSKTKLKHTLSWLGVHVLKSPNSEECSQVLCFHKWSDFAWNKHISCCFEPCTS